MLKIKDIVIVIHIRLIEIVGLFVFLCLPSYSFSQVISEENFLKESTRIWEIYNEDIAKVNELLAKHPEKQDSLKKVADNLLAISINETQKIGAKYASLSSGLEQLYGARLNLTKDTLLSILNMTPLKLKASPYGRSIRAHIDTEQIEVGDKYADFTGTDSNGNTFVLSSLEGKKILLLYGAVGCMEENARKDLLKLYEETARDDFEIVVFCSYADLQQLNKLKRYFDSDYIFVSDFLGDHSPVKIKYGLQPIPAFLLINNDGVVLLKTTEVSANNLKTLIDYK